MSLDRVMFVFAGFMILLSVLLSLTIHPWWIALAVFVGLNMIQAAFTGFCPAAMLFKRLGARSGPAFD